MSNAFFTKLEQLFISSLIFCQIQYFKVLSSNCDITFLHLRVTKKILNCLCFSLPPSLACFEMDWQKFAMLNSFLPKMSVSSANSTGHTKKGLRKSCSFNYYSRRVWHTT